MSKPTSEQKNRWNAKTYKRYTIFLRYDRDADVIAILDGAKESTGLTEYILDTIRKSTEKE